jgi:hypothetical protein
MCVHDVVDNGPARYYSPRHTMPVDSRNEGSKCASTTRRAIFAVPYFTGAALKSVGRGLHSSTFQLNLERFA